MSGRKLGRLYGSLLVLAVAAIIGLVDVGGDLRTADLIWTNGDPVGTNGDLIWTGAPEDVLADGDLIWTVAPVDAPAGGGR
ncbi:hypothetical protein [Micromonospora sp. NPDC047074]|uniref:hypothetical protein n=1 Tax=Micromonospora sp. NPDC047074 TaxID=3154339 RepID=UPI0033F66E66